jgi:hypothetical protein
MVPSTPAPAAPAREEAREPATASRPTIGVVLGLLLAGALVAQFLIAQPALSATCDETFYLNAGTRIFRHRSFRECAEVGVAPLPVLLVYWWPALHAREPREGSCWTATLEDPGLVAEARLLHVLIIGVPLLLTTYGWLLARRGPTTAALGAGLLTFSPGFLAHASLATTDACFCLFALLSLLALTWFCDRPSIRRFLVLSLAVGLALSAKYTGLALVGVAGVLFVRNALLAAPPSRPWAALRGLARAGLQTVGLSAIALLTGWACHGFQCYGPLKQLAAADTPDFSPWVKVLGRGPWAERVMDFAHYHLPQPAVLQGLRFQTRAASQDYPDGNYLWGRRSDHGWWYFYLAALAVKSTISELAVAGLLCLLAVALGLRYRRRGASRPRDVTRLAWLVTAALLLGLASLSCKQAGVRYVLLLGPLMVLLVADLLGDLVGSRLAPVVLGPLLALQVVSAAASAPNYLVYFNGLAGGPAAGHRYLLDSNLEWGQNLPALRHYLEQTDRPRAVLAHFGHCLPAAYGLDAADWRFVPEADWPGYGHVVISATLRQGLYMRGDFFSDFRALEPQAVVEHALFVYDLRDPDVRDALREAQARYLDHHPEVERP